MTSRIALLGLVLALSAGASAQTGFVESDHFEIALVNHHRWIWNDANTPWRSSEFTLVRPLPPEPGFYILGDVPAASHYVPLGGERTAPHTIAVRPKPGFEHLLAPALRFEKVWGSDMYNARVGSVAMYRAICPDGYHALGHVANDPEDANFRCMSRNELAAASWEEDPIWKLWYDQAMTIYEDYLGAWRPTFDKVRPQNRLIMVLNSFTSYVQEIGSDQPFTPSYQDQAWALSFSFDSLPNPFEDLPHDHPSIPPAPILEGPAAPRHPTATMPAVEFRVPFFLVTDPDYPTEADQWAASPYYTIARTVHYEFVADYDNDVGCTVPSTDSDTFTHTASTGLEQESNWAAELGAYAEASATVEGSLEPLGMGASASATATVGFTSSYGWGGSTNRTSSESTDWSHSVAKNTYSALYALKSTYQVFRADGSHVPNTNARATTSYKFVDWVPDGWDPDDPCGTGHDDDDHLADGPHDADAGDHPMAGGATDLPIIGGTTLEHDRHYVSRSGNHFLILPDNGELSVYTAEGDYVWGLYDLGVDTGRIHTVSFQSDGNLAAYDASGNFIWGALHGSQPHGTTLRLTDEGALHIVTPDHRTVWSSTH